MVTNNETYFFRETHQFDLLVNHVIPERRAALRGRPLRFLSAGCSSGEEPYSLSIALHNAGLPLAGVTWEIDACDLNPERIARAQQALYPESSLRACDADARRNYFTPEPAAASGCKEKYRRGVRCFQANLLAPNGALGWAVYDAILCRNLLIYFSDEAFASLIGLFARSLLPGGYLLPRPLGIAARSEDRLRTGDGGRRGGLPQAGGGRVIRVFLVDDSAFVRRALTRVLAIEPELPGRGRGGERREALARIAEADPDLVTLDVAMPGMDGLQLLRRCCAGSRRSRC